MKNIVLKKLLVSGSRSKAWFPFFLFLIVIPQRVFATTIPLFHFEIFPTMAGMFTYGMLNYLADLSLTFLVVFIPIILIIMLVQRS
jgi:hypothetical protein